MADQDNNILPEVHFVNYEEPGTRPPPRLETGALAWIRENLFSSALNTVLTLLGALIAFYSVYTLTDWVISDGNWFAITANFRSFMLGRYEQEYEWRTSLSVLYVAFVAGAAIVVWLRQIARTALITLIVLLTFLWIVPPVVRATMPLPYWYASVSNESIGIGAQAEVPPDQQAFIARSGDVLTFEIADYESDEALANMAGFVDPASNFWRNSANALLEGREIALAARSALISHYGAEIPRLTQTQIEEYVEQLFDNYEGEDAAELETQLLAYFPPPVVIDETVEEEADDTTAEDATEEPATVTLDRDGLVQLLDRIVRPIQQAEIATPLSENRPPVNISIYQVSADGLERSQVGETQILTTVEDTARFELPEDGWYILERTTDVESGIAILRTSGLYPSRQTATLDDGEGVGASRGFVDNFIRMTDSFRTTNILPEGDSDDLDFVNISRNQYRGDRSFGEYMRAYVAPFLSDIAFHTTLVLLASVLGYVVLEAIRRANGADTAASLGSYLLLLSPLVIWVLVNGMSQVTVMYWLLLIAVFLAASAIYHLMRPEVSNRKAKLEGDSALDRSNWIMGLVAAIVVYAILYFFTRMYDTGGLPRLLTIFGFIPLGLAVFLGYNAPPIEEARERTTELIRNGGSALVLLVVVFGLLQFGIVADANQWVLSPSDPDRWGGLLLTMMLTIFGIIVAFPIGVSLALGRRSDLPAISWLCTAYIELIRGSPFITVLFFAQLLIPLVNPAFAEVPNTYRALGAVIAFSAAYLAENVRGGLQSLPPGQTEAAKALGLNGWQTTIFITMPQALRAVIPALVGQFISLFKDTSLVAIVGLLDLVGIVNSMVVQPSFLGTRKEGLLFISIIYFVGSYVMSYVSRLLEASGSGSTRRM